MDFTGGAEDRVKSPPSPPPALLARQGSIYELKMDELESTLSGAGKELGSVNMDELLRSIWTAEESFTMAGMADESCSAAAEHGLLRQGSLTLPRTLSTKTVDELWPGLVSDTDAFPSSHGQDPPASNDAVVQQQPNFGEMTLEEFLVRAGVVKEEINPSPAPTNPAGQASVGGGLLFDELPTVIGNYCGLTLGFNQVDPSGGDMSESANRHGSAANLGLGIGSMTAMVGLDRNGFLEAKVLPTSHLASDMIGKDKGDLSRASPDPCLVSDEGKEPKNNVSVEKIMERRQRRMVKNRESAARSRARKQAYTMGLEAEVAKLKQQNAELKRKQEEILEMQKNNQAQERISPQQGAKKPCFRRTQTGPW